MGLPAFSKGLLMRPGAEGLEQALDVSGSNVYQGLADDIEEEYEDASDNIPAFSTAAEDSNTTTIQVAQVSPDWCGMHYLDVIRLHCRLQ